MGFNLPEFVPVEDLAQHLGVPVRGLKDRVKELGACCKFGHKLLLLPEHVEIIMRESQCPSKSESAAKSGTTQGRLPGGDFETLLERLTKPSPKGSPQKPKQKNGVVTSMAPKR